MSMTNTGAGKAIALGASAGVIASLVMAMYAMGAALIKGAGFFTPLHHIASLIAPGDAMMASMKAAMAGNSFHIVVGTAVVGAIVHMMTGAMYGAVFGVVATRANLRGAAAAGAGLVYGGLVFVMSAFIGLPLAAGIFGAGDPIANMAAMAGWGTFVVEHLLFGVALGVLLSAFAAHEAPARAAR